MGEFAASWVSRLVTVLAALALTLTGFALVAPSANAAADAWQSGDPSFTAPSRHPDITGVQYHGLWSDYSDSARAAILDRMASAGVKYVRLDVAWAQIQPNPPSSANGGYDLGWAVPRIDARLKEITDRGMKALMVFYWAPQWSSGTSNKNGVPRSAAEFGDAAAWAANRWQSALTGIELWNEPDLPEFLADTSVATYTGLVKNAYPKIKAVASALTVVAGAPTYVKTSWYEAFYANGGAGHYDALGIHPYIGVADQPVSTCDTSYREYYPCNIPNLLSLMQANGDGGKRVWATEYGWSTHNESSYGAPVPNWKRGVTEAEQATNLLAMQEYLGQYPQVEASFWYNDWNKATGDQQEDNWGLLRRDFSPKPAYYAMKCAASGVCGAGPTTAPTADPTSPAPAPTTGSPTAPAPTSPTASAPAAPTGLTGSAPTSSSVKLTWKSSAGATSYTVYRNGKKVATTTTTAYTDAGLRAATRYSYSVTATNAVGTGPASAPVTVTTLKRGQTAAQSTAAKKGAAKKGAQKAKGTKPAQRKA